MMTALILDVAPRILVEVSQKNVLRATLTLMTVAASSYKKSAHIYQPTRRHVSDDSRLYS